MANPFITTASPTMSVDPDSQALQRQKQYAAMLLQQNQQPQGQMVGGHFVAPSWTQQLNSALNPLVGAYMMNRADTEQLAVNERQQKAMQNNIARALQTMKGTPGGMVQEIATEANLPEGQTLVDDQGVATLAPTMKPAVAGNKELAIAQLLRPNASALEQQVAGKLIEGEFREPKWEKAELTDPATGNTKQGWVNVNSPNPESTFRQGGEKPAISPMDAMKGRFEGWYTGSVPTGGVSPAGASSVNVGGGAKTTFSPQGAISMPGLSPSAAIQANKEVFVDKAKRQVEYAEKAPAAIEMMNQTLTNINDLIGDAKVVDGKVVYGKKAPHAGFEQSVGFGTAPLGKYIPGSDISDFRARFDQVKGQAFLQAFETLKGAGQITEVEGAKATNALNRMNLAQSEKEFILAAREFEDQVNKGMELARKRAGLPQPSGQWRVK